MAIEDAAITVIDALESQGADFMLVGSFASNYHGIPRSTKDAAFVVQMHPELMAGLLARLGPSFRRQPQIRFETATGTTRHILDVADTAFQIEIFALSDDPHDRERFARRQRVPFLGRQTWLPTAEDVIITKLRWAQQLSRTKDLDDIRAVIAVQGARLAWDYIDAWCEEHGTRALLDDLRRSVPH